MLSFIFTWIYHWTWHGVRKQSPLKPCWPPSAPEPLPEGPQTGEVAVRWRYVDRRRAEVEREEARLRNAPQAVTCMCAVARLSGGGG